MAHDACGVAQCWETREKRSQIMSQLPYPWPVVLEERKIGAERRLTEGARVEVNLAVADLADEELCVHGDLHAALGVGDDLAPQQLHRGLDIARWHCDRDRVVGPVAQTHPEAHRHDPVISLQTEWHAIIHYYYFDAPTQKKRKKRGHGSNWVRRGDAPW